MMKKSQRRFALGVLLLVGALLISMQRDGQSYTLENFIKQLEQEFGTVKPPVTSPQPSPTVNATVSGVASESAIRVVRVIDGDTIELENGKRLRYIGIDTPETKHPRVGVECFGKEASEKNKEFVEGKVVQLEKDVSQTDRNGRLLRYVYLDGVMVNEVLVAEGYAQAISYPPDVKYQAKFRAAEQSAREQKKGFWRACQ